VECVQIGGANTSRPLMRGDVDSSSPSSACFLHSMVLGEFHEVRVRMDAPLGRIVQMFTLRLRDPFGCQGVSCVKLPAAVAFPTDDRLLQRIEKLRSALPANNVKPLWKSRHTGSSADAPSAPRERGVDTRPMINVSLGAFPLRFEPRPTSLPPVQIAGVAHEEQRSTSAESHACVVPLARAAGSLARGHDRLSRALHDSAVAS
jgi:hypothetical protein